MPAVTGAPRHGREDGGPRFERPVFIVSSPRAGSSLLFETLAQSPDVVTIGGENHAVLEQIPALSPRNRDWESNRLGAADAGSGIVERLTDAFFASVRDRDGQRPAPGTRRLRLLEKTPKNSLRVPFLSAAFPDALFVYLYRSPRETVSSMLDAWRSGRFVTYPDLPGWEGPKWSLLLVPGWRGLSDRSLPEIVAEQWAATTSTLLDDLEALDASRWCVASYDRLVAEPQPEVERLCAFLGLRWDRALEAPLPLAAHTLTPPKKGKWRRNAAALREPLARVQPVAERARELFAQPERSFPRRRVRPAARPAPPAPIAFAAPASASKPAPKAPSAFRSRYSTALPAILGEVGATLAVSTYQSGRLVLVRADGRAVNTHLRAFEAPMGVAVGRGVLAVGTQTGVTEYRDQPEVARRLDPPGRHDACYLPRLEHVTGDVKVHEVVYTRAGLLIVATRFSCLARLDGVHSFVPVWSPPFVSALAPEDRCHLNGVGVVDGEVRFATALGATDAPAGWREGKASGGLLLEVPSGRTLLSGLSMPHSPRWHDGRLWLLESGRGTLAAADLRAGTVETVVELPGFTRGLAFAGRWAFVGLSQVRESVFGGIPLCERLSERLCGVWVVDLSRRAVAAFLRFDETVEEIFDVQLLPGRRWPEIVEPGSELLRSSFVLPSPVPAGSDGAP